VADRSVSVLFVDGSHEYPDVAQDIDDWTTALVPGAFVGFNDPWLAGVKRALLERVCRTGSPYRNARWMVNSLFFDYLPDAPWTRQDAARLRRLRTFLRLGRLYTVVTNRGRINDASPRARRLVGRIDATVGLRTMRAILPVADDAPWEMR
jgi:hypothetical protein